MAKKSNPPYHTHEHIEKFKQWQRLKRNQRYIKVSDEMRKLRETAYTLSKSEEFQENHKSALLKRYYSLLGKIEKNEQEICKEFSLTMWCDPEDPNIHIGNALGVFDGDLPIRSFPRPASLPSNSRTVPEKNGKIYLEVNILDAPIEDLKRNFERIILAERAARKENTSRLRPESIVQDFEAFALYEKKLSFSVVARQLKRKRSTVKEQYIRAACYLGLGTEGNSRRNLVSSISIDDQVTNFNEHIAECPICLKADNSEEYCEFAKKFIDAIS